jgi:hypothetical protein
MFQYYFYPPRDESDTSRSPRRVRSWRSVLSRFSSRSESEPSSEAESDAPEEESSYTDTDASTIASKQSSSDSVRKSFVQLVPPLPDFLSSDWVLGQFRWWGDRSRVEETDGPESMDELGQISPNFGGVWDFVKEFKGEVAKVLLISLIWIALIFVSPLSMNLVCPPAFCHCRIQCSTYLSRVR